MSLSDSQRNILLKFARATIVAHLSGKTLPLLPKVKDEFASKNGAFVTLHKRKTLRGCIGNMVGHGPLVNTIQEMAIAAATSDPRFMPVRIDEMPEIDLEISVLSPMRRITDVSEIQVGVHGIMMSRGLNRGVLLPQVAVEYNWDRETFLKETCNKAGLPADAWKDSKTTIEIFSAEVFGEKDYNMGCG